MLFLHYVKFQRHYDIILARLEDYLEQEARLFQATQPHSPSADTSGGGGYTDRMARYAAKKDELERGRRQAQEAVEAYTETLKTLRRQLMASEAEEDKVFVARYIRRMKVHQIAARLGMGEATVYRMLRRIRDLIESDRLEGV